MTNIVEKVADLIKENKILKEEAKMKLKENNLANKDDQASAAISGDASTSDGSKANTQASQNDLKQKYAEQNMDEVDTQSPTKISGDATPGEGSKGTPEGQTSQDDLAAKAKDTVMETADADADDKKYAEAVDVEEIVNVLEMLKSKIDAMQARIDALSGSSEAADATSEEPVPPMTESALFKTVYMERANVVESRDKEFNKQVRVLLS